MKNNRVLITGGNGFIGNHIYQIFNGLSITTARLDIVGDVEFVGDASNYQFLQNTINTFNPNIVIHCAARKNLPDCEENKEASFISNVISTEHLVQLSKQFPFKIVYISSDVVFDGLNGNYDINSYINPLNWYGKTKSFSEIVLRNCADYAICRTALVIGKLSKEYKNILAKETTQKVLVNQTLLPQYIYSRLKSKLSVELPSIYISNPTPVELLAEIILKIINNNQKGIFHTSGVDAVSRVDVANIIADIFKFDKSLIKIDNTVVSQLRPKNISLNVDKTFSSLEIDTSLWGLRNYLSNKELYE